MESMAGCAKCYGRTWGKKETDSLGSWRKKETKKSLVVCEGKKEKRPHLKDAHTHQCLSILTAP